MAFLNETEPRPARGPQEPAGELLTWEPPTWEYREEPVPFPMLGMEDADTRRLRLLNECGADGWELVCLLRDRFLFKRQRRDTEPEAARALTLDGHQVAAALRPKRALIPSPSWAAGRRGSGRRSDGV